MIWTFRYFTSHVFFIGVKTGCACANKLKHSLFTLRYFLSPSLRLRSSLKLKRLRHSFLQLFSLNPCLSLFGEAAMSDKIKKIIPWGSLPDEILTYIFVFLPVKSIIICASVSKAWKSLIKTPTFISTYHHHSLNKNKNQNQNQNLLFFGLCSESENRKEFYALYNEDDADFTQHARFDYPFRPPPGIGNYSVVGTCNGLLFLSKFFDGDNSLYLWNPCVGKSLKLHPISPTLCMVGSAPLLDLDLIPKLKIIK